MNLAIKIIVGLVVLGFFSLFILPTSLVSGQPSYNAEISFRVNQQKAIGWIPGIDDYTLDNVNIKKGGESRIWELDSMLSAWEIGNLEICISSHCQWETEIFTPLDPGQTFGEQRTVSETITHVEEGTHNVRIKMYVENKVVAEYTGQVTI